MLSKSWHRRFAEVAFLLSIAVIALYVVPIATNVSAEGMFGISLWVAVAAGVTALTSVIFYIITPKQPSYWRTLIIYLLFSTMSGLLIYQTGDILSPFIALWMLVSFFAGVFAFYGSIPILVADSIFVAAEYLEPNFSVGTIAMVAFGSLLPLVAGMLVWRNQGDDAGTKDVKNLANQLSEVANKSEIVINAIGDGVMAVDAKGTIQLINPAAQEILGWGKQDALMLSYKSVLQLVDQDNHQLDATRDPVQQVLNTNQQVRSNDLTIITKTNKKIQASLVVSPIGETGSGAIAVFRDITKEKAEEREQAEFISTASHEMRTPVASIEGYLGLALNPNTSQIDDKARGFLQKAHESAQHLGRLFQDLLDVSKSEDGRMSNNPRVVDMTAFAENVAQSMESKAKEKGLVLTYKPTGDNRQKKIAPVYFVNVDNDHIREVLDNLIENAIKYTPKGEVTVDLNGSDDKVIISVKDTGLGIPAEDIPHLFQKFYRVNNTDRQAIGGTGLGLYLCRRLTEAMGGRLWVESTYGQGSTFFVELPRISSQEAEQLKRQQASQQTNPTPGTPAVASPVAPQPAKNVPRGESLTREQIAEKVRQLEAMSRQAPVATRQIPVQSAPSDNNTGQGQA